MKESQSEDRGLAEAVEQFKYFMRKKYEMDKEKSSGGAVMKKYVSPCGMEMDEEIFAIMMERNPWFTLAAGRLPVPRKDEEEMTYLEYKRAIFAYIFGSFGFEKDLAKAELYCCHGINELCIFCSARFMLIWEKRRAASTILCRDSTPKPLI